MSVGWFGSGWFVPRAAALPAGTLFLQKTDIDGRWHDLRGQRVNVKFVVVKTKSAGVPKAPPGYNIHTISTLVLMMS